MVNAASSHVARASISNNGEVDPGETACKILFMAPVGQGNLTVGYNVEPGKPSPMPEFFPAFVELPVHLKIIGPSDKTILEQDIITPASIPINFDTRGEYKIYVTNNGSERTGIAIGKTFEMNNPQNREADKYLLSETLIVVGAVVVAVGLTLNLVSKLRNNARSKSYVGSVKQ